MLVKGGKTHWDPWRGYPWIEKNKCSRTLCSLQRLCSLLSADHWTALILPTENWDLLIWFTGWLQMNLILNAHHQQAEFLKSSFQHMGITFTHRCECSQNWICKKHISRAIAIWSNLTLLLHIWSQGMIQYLLLRKSSSHKQTTGCHNSGGFLACSKYWYKKVHLWLIHSQRTWGILPQAPNWRRPQHPPQRRFIGVHL